MYVRPDNIEYTVMLYDEDEWRPVGTSGNFRHVRNEFNDWKRDCPEAFINGHLTVAYRKVNPWKRLPLFGSKDAR